MSSINLCLKLHEWINSIAELRNPYLELVVVATLQNYHMTPKIYIFHILLSSVQSLSQVWLCNPMDCNMPGFPVHHQLLEPVQTHVYWVSDAIQPSHSLLSPSPAFNLSQHQGVFQWVTSSHQVAKVLELQLQHQSFHEYSGLISFRFDWFGLLAVHGTLKSLLQHHSSKASVLWCSAFFIVQLSHPYMTTVKTIALTIWTFVGKIMSLLFNMLISLVIAFLPRSQCLNFKAAVTICGDFGAQENKVSHCFHCLPTYLPWSDGTRFHDLHFLNVEF